MGFIHQPLRAHFSDPSKGIASPKKGPRRLTAFQCVACVAVIWNSDPLPETTRYAGLHRDPNKSRAARAEMQCSPVRQPPWRAGKSRGKAGRGAGCRESPRAVPGTEAGGHGRQTFVGDGRRHDIASGAVKAGPQGDVNDMKILKASPNEPADHHRERNQAVESDVGNFGNNLNVSVETAVDQGEARSGAAIRRSSWFGVMNCVSSQEL